MNSFKKCLIFPETRVWASADVNQKENLQKLVYPDGGTYNRKTEAFRTDKINEVFAILQFWTLLQAEIKKDKPVMKPICPVLSGELDNVRTCTSKI